MGPWMSCLDRVNDPSPAGRLSSPTLKAARRSRDGWGGKPSPYERVAGRSPDGCGAVPGLTWYRPSSGPGGYLPPGEGSLRRGCLLVLRLRYIPICSSIFSFRDEFSSLNDFIGCRKCNSDSRIAFHVSKVIRYVHNPHTVCHCSGLDPNRYLFIQFDRGLLANSCSADSG